jgi:hypothetical protein
VAPDALVDENGRGPARLTTADHRRHRDDRPHTSPGDRLVAAITAAAGQPATGPVRDAGLSRLHDDAERLRVDDDIAVAVASLVARVRIAEARDL